MKISNSKKQLAKIIHENGGWREEAQFSAQDKDGEVFHYAAKPSIDKGSEVWGHKGCIGYGEFPAKTLPNWHQTILSRDEYFYLHPAPDAKHEFCESVMRSIPEQSDKPTIEQLAADYRNAKDFADRKQQEADAAKADAEAKLAELVAAGKALGLVLSVTDAESEPELVIIDWRDLRIGDVVWYGGDDELSTGEYHVMEIEAPNYEGYRTVLVNGNSGGHWIDTSAGWRFIRRP